MLLLPLSGRDVKEEDVGLGEEAEPEGQGSERRHIYGARKQMRGCPGPRAVGGKRGVTASGHRFLLGDKDILNLVVMMAAHLCESTKNH